MNKNKGETIIEDAVLTGILKAFGCDYLPQRDSAGRVIFSVSGGVDETLRRIYLNEPIGALDVLQGIKNARQAIFSLKGQEKGVNRGQHYNR